MALRKGADIQGRAFEFSCGIVSMADLVFNRGYAAVELAKQVLRSGTSIGANLEEADAAHSRADFISKCTISLREARETHYWLRLLRRTGKINDIESLPLLAECDELIAILTTIVKRSKATK